MNRVSRSLEKQVFIQSNYRLSNSSAELYTHKVKINRRLNNCHFLNLFFFSQFSEPGELGYLCLPDKEGPIHKGRGLCEWWSSQEAAQIITIAREL
jgi:hypothetical protein